MAHGTVFIGHEADCASARRSRLPGHVTEPHGAGE
jgi:hypothetical protein